MGDTNKTYRIRTEVGTDKNLTVNLEQEYNSFEILSLELSQEDTYRLQSVNYGVIVGRVLANGGFGIPNAKISVFIESEESTYMDVILAQLYPYRTTRDEVDYRRYNLLPDQKVDTCHRPVGSFPNKTYVLDNDDIIEIFDKYYKYTTRTNNAGDFIICGVPVGTQTVHMDLDLSDCGILSQKPRDFYYKGYNVEQFENPNQFKTSNDLDSLSQIFSQDQVVEVIPFWGNRNQGETIGITRCDIDVNFKFEPTCVFIGSVISDNSSKGVSKRCVPTNTMGAMDELVTGEGTIEMIRKRTDGAVEEVRIKGTELINANGVWCYQIPMNLDYMMTDEYGNMVPTDSPSKGIPTRARVRFRVSMHDTEENTDNYFLSKALVPNNPQKPEESDFNFGSQTKETSFRDMFWNNVYTVKSFIPRFQKSQLVSSERFTGIKHCNIYANNNPIPYNNIRIRLPFMFTVLCALIKSYIRIVGFVNKVIFALQRFYGLLTGFTNDKIEEPAREGYYTNRYIVLSDGLCPDLENWYFAPGASNRKIKIVDPSDAWGWQKSESYSLMEFTLKRLTEEYDGKETANGESGGIDSTSIDHTNSTDDEEGSICLTNSVDYLISCVEMNLAQEHKVINFDFYNDWLNGVVYLPRWKKFVTRKKSYLFGLIKIPAKIKGCINSAHGDNNSISFKRTRRYTQQCALAYDTYNNKNPKIATDKGCVKRGKKQKCHKKGGFAQYKVFGKWNGGFIQEKTTSKKQYVYYVKPCEWGKDSLGNYTTKVNFFATDIVLLGSLNDCSQQGLPQAFKHLSSSSYQMPTNLALTNMDSDGYLYADNTGTICTGKKNLGTVGVNALTGNKNTYTNTANYYSSNSDESVVYEEHDDYIPLTEAAGIAWNFTGPDQGEPDYKNKFYQPGGHFLGISCINSETNIKSCVNLSRACEAGTELSERKEIVSHVTDDGTVRFKYFIPSGLIAKDEIIDQDFRSMFATMNHHRLIADAYNKETGYLNYSFIYKRPAAFDGGINDNLSDWYNRSMKDLVVIDKNALSDEEAQDVKENSYMRTIDANNRDYYFYRLGINSYTEQGDKYLIKSGTQMKMPQYENSFYFYFGLRPGATALDELNKQFFASCEGDTVEDGDTGFWYVALDPNELPEGVTVYAKLLAVPQNPTEDYIEYIQVNGQFYHLEPVENGPAEYGEIIDDGSGGNPASGGGNDVIPPITVTANIQFISGAEIGDIVVIEPNERDVDIFVEIKDISEPGLQPNRFVLNAGGNGIQISNTQVQYLGNGYMWKVTTHIDRNTSLGVKFGTIDVLAYVTSASGQNYISEIMPLRVNVTQHPSSY